MNKDRRMLIGATTTLLLAGAAGKAQAQETPPARTVPQGSPGEFDFLHGEWRIAHRKRREGGWDEFAGDATCWTILGGVGSVEELRIPVRNFSGLGLRMLDVENRIWSDHWVNAQSGVVTTPGTTGGFINGEGVFISEYDDNGTTVLVRGLWDRITGSSHRWLQAYSRDGGATWADDWIMEWTKVGEPGARAPA
ncbi:MAG: hypothetical protein K2X34_09135 [Hyphomonadaceae bacterium]|nr:hypothetical protein [Hyphomonadaceae bacterium]